VRTIFTGYLELGSLAALAEYLDRSGIRTKRRKSDGERPGVEVPFSTGALAHMLKNRFYVGEVVYRGEVYRGDHPPIIEQSQFEAVQARLAAQAVERQVRVREAPAILTGRIFDDRGNRMTPTHSNKGGVRYRYYVSHPILQKRKQDAGTIPRVPAPEVEQTVIESLRAKVGRAEANDVTSDLRALVEDHLEAVVITNGALEVRIKQRADSPPAPDGCIEEGTDTTEASPATVTVPCSAACPPVARGIVHSPAPSELPPQRRDAVLLAIAKARSWMDDLSTGRVASLADIAVREGKVERHIRALAPLAFVSPGLIAALLDGRASPTLTVTGLTNALPYSWNEQQQALAAQCKSPFA
jgi:predicted  nucleic acid-binding Zn-ribbon protein